MNILAYLLSQSFEEISPYDFYRFIFRDDLDGDEDFTKGKYTGIAVEVTKKKKKYKTTINGKTVIKEKPVCFRHTVTDDLDVIDELCYSDNFCLMAPISYAGKTRHSKNARVMYALGIELDNLRMNKKTGECDGYYNLIHRFKTIEYLPKPTFIVASGTGVHLYYVFDKPLVLYPNTIESLKAYKRAMTYKIWQKDVTTLYKREDVQQESIFQGFRMPGTPTKKGDKAVAFITGERVSVEYMNGFVPKTYKGSCDIIPAYQNDLSLKQAKELYPEWYNKVIVNGDKSRKKWAVNRAVYDWWLQQIIEGAADGHRYYCLMMLAIYAIKCNKYDEKKNPNPVTYEEFESDAWSLLELFDSRTKNENNHFREEDVAAAIQIYEDKDYFTYPVNSIAYRSGIEIPKNKRNGRKQSEHIKLMNFIRDEINKNTNWRATGGRKSKEDLVRDYAKLHPEASPTKIAKELHISRTTVYKYLD